MSEGLAVDHVTVVPDQDNRAWDRVLGNRLLDDCVDRREVDWRNGRPLGRCLNECACKKDQDGKGDPEAGSHARWVHSAFRTGGFLHWVSGS